MVFINKMKKIIIKTCSCFLEKAVWFVNSPKRYPYWIFLSAIKDVGKKIFLSDEWNAFKTVIIMSCCLIVCDLNLFKIRKLCNVWIMSNVDL